MYHASIYNIENGFAVISEEKIEKPMAHLLFDPKNPKHLDLFLPKLDDILNFIFTYVNDACSIHLKNEDATHYKKKTSEEKLQKAKRSLDSLKADPVWERLSKKLTLTDTVECINNEGFHVGMILVNGIVYQYKYHEISVNPKYTIMRSIFDEYKKQTSAPVVCFLDVYRNGKHPKDPMKIEIKGYQSGDKRVPDTYKIETDGSFWLHKNFLTYDDAVAYVTTHVSGNMKITNDTKERFCLTIPRNQKKNRLAYMQRTALRDFLRKTFWIPDEITAHEHIWSNLTDSTGLCHGLVQLNNEIYPFTHSPLSGRTLKNDILDCVAKYLIDNQPTL